MIEDLKYDYFVGTYRIQGEYVDVIREEKLMESVEVKLLTVMRSFSQS